MCHRHSSRFFFTTQFNPCSTSRRISSKRDPQATHARQGRVSPPRSDYDSNREQTYLIASTVERTRRHSNWQSNRSGPTHDRMVWEFPIPCLSSCWLLLAGWQSTCSSLRSYYRVCHVWSYYIIWFNVVYFQKCNKELIVFGIKLNSNSAIKMAIDN